ncbi:SulP family inorganic anion transporter [Pseudosporangium ferrugineum]|uniref:SulP family inorganic anion transporter n=1 Tax=Pseudosporangium ferrugineum TaxID=439699 RepID=UPI001FE4C414|nr:sulfate permease [Pseudosporangium ferrugineum]
MRVVAGYRRRWLPKDLVAGLVLSSLLVPQGMAYAELAGLPPITGLYTTVFGLIGYALFGSSRILVVGPDSSLGPMIAAVLITVVGTGADVATTMGLASMLALMVGVIMAVAGVARLGFVADLLSKPTQIGYMNGLAVTIFVSQLPKLCGFSVDGDGLLNEAAGFLRGLASGDAVPAACAVGLVTLAIIVVLQRWLPKVPAVLIAVVAAIAATWVADLGSRGVVLVGPLPAGFPPLSLPHASWSQLVPLLAGAVGITVVSLADTISTASSFAARTGQEIRPDQEMIGVGAANVAASFFQGFPVSTSGSRTAVAEQSGARTQVTGIVGAAVILAMLLLTPGLLRDLPQPALGAVVIAASMSLADVRGTVRLWRRRRLEFLVSITAFLGVALLGVLPGIGVAVGMSVLNVFRRVWWPYQTELRRAPGVPGYHDVRSYPVADRLPGLMLFRFDAPLIFANARVFRDQIRGLARAEPRPRWIVLAAEPVTDVDTTAADMLTVLLAELDADGIVLVWAELKDPVRRKIDRYGLTEAIGPAHFFATLDEAVSAYRAQTGAEWVSSPGPADVPPRPEAAERPTAKGRFPRGG